MDNSNYPTNRPNDHLGVNKIGKNIKKSPLHLPNFGNTARQLFQPQVYNIDKNDFRNVVQQLTGSPSHSQEPHPRPPNNPSRPPSSRLQRIRPPPLMPLSRTLVPLYHPLQAVPARQHLGSVPSHNSFIRPSNVGQQPPSNMVPPPMTFGDQARANAAESPISAYMRYLQNSIIDPRQSQNQLPFGQHPQGPGNFQGQPHAPGLLPNFSLPPLPSPRMNGHPPPRLPSPRMDGLPPFPSPRIIPSPLPSPRMNGAPSLLPSPTSQLPLPSPSSYLNLASPRSPYPLLSPGCHHPPPMTPNFKFPQSGLLGPGPQPPLSPGLGFPSPSGFFAL